MTQNNVISKKTDYIYKFEDGLIGLNTITVFLFDFFDKKFEQIAHVLGAEKRIYPSLIPINDLQKTGYLRTSPQYTMFCSDVKTELENLEKLDGDIKLQKFDGHQALRQPQYALSPAACLHVYIELKNSKLNEAKTITFLQNVFRNEGERGYEDIGRFRDYHVREIVFVGEHQWIVDKREYTLDLTYQLAKRLGIKCKSEVACDPFILPRMQKYKKIQKIDKSKIEMQLNAGEKNISGASYNLHGTAFTYPFNISVKDVEHTETGCVGFGIERWIVAFLRQFGDEPGAWPESVITEWRDFLDHNNL